MDFGIFLGQTRRGADQPGAFQEMFDLVDASDAWGLDIVWMAEMMVNPARSVLSAPLLVASWWRRARSACAWGRPCSSSR
jgi:alkanesulfonate monooxygenase SsuD/methylene tetrahydromethanopterin reductase-like flavin-dependent oxidoreductase (luciferase family)